MFRYRVHERSPVESFYGFQVRFLLAKYRVLG